MLLKMISWLLGYVVVEVVGENIERFMNFCSTSKKDVWGFTVIPGGVKVNVRLSDVKSIRSIARKSKVKLMISQKKGLWFCLRPLQKRWGIVVGVIIFCVLMWLLNGRIWMIHIQGNQTIPTETIKEMLFQNGVHQGISSKEFEWATLRQKIIAQNPQISWMSFNPNGSLLSVDISETTTPPKMNNNDFPCNIMATCDGRIVEMQVYTGTPMVQVGDAVVKGDLLISGAVEYSDGYTLFRKASGKVMAETVHEYNVFVPFQYNREEPTGEVRIRRVFSCFGMEIPLYFGSVASPYMKEISQKNLTVKNVVLPLGMKKAVFKKINIIPATRTVEQAKQKGRAQTEAYKRETFLEEQVKNVEISYNITKDGVEVKSRFFCIENIIFCEKLLIF